MVITIVDGKGYYTFHSLEFVLDTMYWIISW